MTKGLLLFGAPLVLALSPATGLAQEADDVAASSAAMEQAMGAFAQAFVVEPLTAEQQARLPLAQSVVERIMPPGTLGEMMGSMFDGILGPMGEVMRPHAADVVAQQLGLQGQDLGLDDEQAASAAALFDPAWEERQRREAEAVPLAMGSLMTAMEPTMRTAMAELYAVHFTDAELADIAAFFATTSGATYARQSYTLASDPRLLSAVFSEMPTFVGGMMAMQQQLADATADLPPVRSFADLSSNERKRLADLLGMTVEDLEYSTQWGAGSEAAAAAVEAAAAAVEAAGKAY
jgi:Uncharacterized protein conserved in bacteria (DUF2059)